MKKIIRLTALSLALSVVGGGFCGCGKNDFSTQYDIIAACSNKALEAVRGKLEINENITAEKDIEGVLETGSSYTLITYTRGDELSYELKKYEDTESDQSYELFTTDMGVFMTLDGSTAQPYDGEQPKILEYITVDFSIDEVENIEITSGKEGTKLYNVTTTGAFADKHDTKLNGGDYDCNLVTYVYQIDSLSRLKSVSVEYKADYTYNGETQETTRTVKTHFEAIESTVDTSADVSINDEMFLMVSETVAKAEKLENAVLKYTKNLSVKNEDGGYDELSSDSFDITTTADSGNTVSDYIGIKYDYSEISGISVKKYYGDSGSVVANEYIISMSPFYTEQLDIEGDGVTVECSDVKYSYIINTDGVLEAVYKEYSFERIEGENTVRYCEYIFYGVQSSSK